MKRKIFSLCTMLVLLMNTQLELSWVIREPVVAEAKETINIIKELATGYSHSGVLVSNGDLYCWGDNTYGQVGNGTTKDQLTPRKVLDNVKSVSLGHYHSGAITTNGDLYCWGDNRFGQVGNGTTSEQQIPQKILSNVKEVSLGYYHSGAITTNGDLYYWGNIGTEDLEDGHSTVQATPKKILSNVKSVFIGINSSWAITTNQDLYCWMNYYPSYPGEAGDNPIINQLTPEKVLSNVKSIACGDWHYGAVTTNGDLYCWGDNFHGQVGNGMQEAQSTPEKVLSNVKAISFGSFHSGAITTNGDLYCWGMNANGEVGNSTTEDQLIPEKVLDNVETISLGYNYTGAVTQNGDLFCWGSNWDGIVGNGTTENQLMPQKILSNVELFSTKGGHGEVLLSSGELFAWGSNNHGQIGNGTTQDQHVPIKVFGDQEISNYDEQYNKLIDMREFVLNPATMRVLRYLYKDENFVNSIAVYQSDKRFADKVVMSMSNMLYRGVDGWKEIFSKETSKEDAEKILAALLENYSTDCEELAKAEKAKKYADLFIDGYNAFLRSDALSMLESDEIKSLEKSIEKVNVEELFLQQKYDQIISSVIKKCDVPLDNKVVQTLNTFYKSKELLNSLQDGLKILGKGLKILSITQDTFNKFYQLESVVEADEMYAEMLLYLQKNCKSVVVQEAAGRVYKVFQGGMDEVFAKLKKDLAGALLIEGVDLVVDLAIKAFPAAEIIKSSYEWGITISNLSLHIGDTQKLKDSMRSVAYIGNCLKSWVVENQTDYLTSLDTDKEEAAGKKLYYSLYMLWETRRQGEITFQNMKETAMETWHEPYTLSKGVLNCLDSYKDSIFNKHKYGNLIGVTVSCPVDIKIYDSKDNLILSLEDGIEQSGYVDNIYYYESYHPYDKDYVKYLYFPDGEDYRMEYIGNNKGTVDCIVFENGNDGEVLQKFFKNVRVDKDSIITIDNINEKNSTFFVQNKGDAGHFYEMYENVNNALTVSNLEFDKKQINLSVGDTYLLGVKITPQNAINQKIAWSSSDSAIVSVNSDGVIKCNSKGKAEVSASVGEVTAKCVVNVKEKTEPTGAVKSPNAVSNAVTIPTRPVKRTNLSATSIGKSIKLKKPVIKSIKKIKGKRIKIVLKKKVKGATGCKVQYSMDKKFRKCKQIYTKKKKIIIKKLKKKKAYYLRICAYKKRKYDILYGKWSEVRIVKI